MTIVGLVIQQHDGTVLFQNVREYLSIEKAHLAAKAFRNQISSYDDASINKGSFKHLTGSIVVLNMYRVFYMILNELFILAISQANDNPFEGAVYLARAKKVLSTVSKELIPAQITKKYMDVSFSLERVLFGEDGLEMLTQKVSSPHQLINPYQPYHHHPTTIGIGNIVSSTPVIPTPVTIGGRLVDNTINVTNQQQQQSNQNNHMYISVPLTLSTMLINNSNIINLSNQNININSNSSNQYLGIAQSNSSSSLSNSNNNIITPSSITPSSSNNNISNEFTSTSKQLSYNNILPTLNSNNVNDNDLDYNSLQFESLLNLENFTIPDKIFTQSNQLPKIDKHIYDPPQTIKWGNPSVQSNSASSTRLTNRIMFTLRHPNAAKEAKERELKEQQEKELREQQEINNMNAASLAQSTNNSGGNSNNNSNNSNNIGSSSAGSASNKSSPSTSPLSSSYNNNSHTSPSSPETSSIDHNDIKDDSNNNKNNNNNNINENQPETPKRKFSLSMGTMHKQPSLNTSNNTLTAAAGGGNENSSVTTAAAPAPVPLTNKKMNFLNF